MPDSGNYSGNDLFFVTKADALKAFASISVDWPRMTPHWTKSRPTPA